MLVCTSFAHNLSQHEHADGIMHAQNTCERCKCYWPWGDMTGKNIMGMTVKVFKKDEFNFKNSLLPNFLCYEMEVASLFNTWLSFLLSCEELNIWKEDCQGHWKPMLQHFLLLTTYQKWYLLPFTMFVKVELINMTQLWGKDLLN